MAEQKPVNLQQRNKVLHQQNENLRADLAKARAELTGLKDELSVKDRKIAQMQQAADIARNDIRNYLNSTSWRITAPMRIVRNFVFRLFGRR